MPERNFLLKNKNKLCMDGPEKGITFTPQYTDLHIALKMENNVVENTLIYSSKKWKIVWKMHYYFYSKNEKWCEKLTFLRIFSLHHHRLL